MSYGRSYKEWDTDFFHCSQNCCCVYFFFPCWTAPIYGKIAWSVDNINLSRSSGYVAAQECDCCAGLLFCVCMPFYGCLGARMRRRTAEKYGIENEGACCNFTKTCCCPCFVFSQLFDQTC